MSALETQLLARAAKASSQPAGGRAEAIGAQIDAVLRHPSDRHELLAILAVLEGRRAVAKEVIRDRQRPDRLMSIAAAAERLDIHEDTIRGYCKAWARDSTPGPRKLRFVQVGMRERKIPESAINEFLDGGGR